MDYATEDVPGYAPAPADDPHPDPAPQTERAPRFAMIDSAVAIGTLTAIGTGGALLGIGWREGETGRVFRLTGRGMLERFGVSSSAAPLASVAVGYVHHLVVATIWGVLLGLVVLRFRGIKRVGAAVMAALAYAWLSESILPAPVRIGFAVTANSAGVFPIGLALTVALLVGAWLACADEAHDRHATG